MPDRRSCHALIWPVAVLLCAAPLPGQSPGSTATTSAVRQAIDSQFVKLINAYRNRDGAAFAAIYAQDAVMRAPEEALTGRSAIQADMTAGLASVKSVANDTATTDSFVTDGNQAIQTGHIVWTEVGPTNTPMRHRLDYAFTWRKDADGVWRIARDMNFETVVK